MNGTSRQALWTVSLALSILGALNWGLVGFLDWNLLAAIFGGSTDVHADLPSRIVYCVIGIAGVVLAIATIGQGREPATTRHVAHGAS